MINIKAFIIDITDSTIIDITYVHNSSITW